MKPRFSNGFFAILITILLTAPLLAIIAAAKPLEPHPDYEWPENTLWGSNLCLDHENVPSGNIYDFASFGAKTGPEYLELFPTIPPGEVVWAGFWKPGHLYGMIVRSQDAPPQTYSWFVEICTNYDGGVSDLTISAALENSTHEFVPSDFSVVLENSAEGIFINLRVENGLIDLQPYNPVYATLYVDNFVPEVNVSVSPSSKEGARGGTIDYTVTLTGLGESPENFDSIPVGSFSYDLSASDDLGWGLNFADSVVDNVLPGENRTTTLIVTIPENAEPGTQDNITVTATSRTDTWVSDNSGCTAIAGEELVFHFSLAGSWNLIGFPVTNENTTPENLLENATYYNMWEWNPVTGGYVKPPDSQPVELGVGYWLKTDLDNIETPPGLPVDNFEISLIADRWNLIGFPIATENDTPANLLENAAYYSMWEWNPVTGGYAKPPDDQPVELGVGYWLITDENRIRLPY